MKKAMIVLITVSKLISCGNEGNGSHVPTDSTGVKCDTCQVDTTIVADPVPPAPPVLPGTTNDPAPVEPEPQPLPKTK